jgi:threonine synthase
MHYYSTNHKAPAVSLRDAVIKGLAPDRGLYMPEAIKRLPDAFYHNIAEMTLPQIAFVVAQSFFGDDVDPIRMKQIVEETFSFDIPLVRVSDNILSLELFHGPTAAFKDVGARFMARLLQYFITADRKHDNKPASTVNVLVATSGDTGSAVANGFYGVEGVRVYVLYPKGKVSEIQEKQFTTLGGNITAIEVDGTFDDCQRLVKEAFLDEELNRKLFLTSANSINVARFLPQAFYYFYAYAQYRRMGLEGEPVFCVPSGNFGNITAGLIAKRMGLPVKRFIAANNSNDIFFEYLQSGRYNPRPSVQTIANAMDVGDPSNFARIVELYKPSSAAATSALEAAPAAHDAIAAEISGAWFTDEAIAHAIARVYESTGYLLDPHGACGYLALEAGLQPGETGIFLETAHPAKFRDTVEPIIGQGVDVPATLRRFMEGTKQTTEIPPFFSSFKNLLLGGE